LLSVFARSVRVFAGCACPRASSRPTKIYTATAASEAALWEAAAASGAALGEAAAASEAAPREAVANLLSRVVDHFVCGRVRPRHARKKLFPG
jgi:hypothetical protein